MEEITIHGRSDLIVSQKTKKTYFTITDQKDMKIICFNPALYEQCVVGSNIQAVIEQGRNVDDTPRLTSIEGSTATPVPVSKGSPELVPQPPSAPLGPEIGMTVKEIGDMIRAGQITKLFGAKIGAELITWYRGRIISTTRIEFDGKDLPSIKPKEE